MWIMHDYPSYGIASSLQTQGYHACPPCGPVEVPAYSTEFLGKIIYHGHRKFLVWGHKWRARRYNALWGGYDEESKEPPKRWTGYEWLAMWTKVEEGQVPLATSGMTNTRIKKSKASSVHPKYAARNAFLCTGVSARSCAKTPIVMAP